jgi:hypothetical protein
VTENETAKIDKFAKNLCRTSPTHCRDQHQECHAPLRVDNEITINKKTKQKQKQSNIDRRTPYDRQTEPACTTLSIGLCVAYDTDGKRKTQNCKVKTQNADRDKQFRRTMSLRCHCTFPDCTSRLQFVLANEMKTENEKLHTRIVGKTVLVFLNTCRIDHLQRDKHFRLVSFKRNNKSTQKE